MTADPAAVLIGPGTWGGTPASSHGHLGCCSEPRPNGNRERTEGPKGEGKGWGGLRRKGWGTRNTTASAPPSPSNLSRLTVVRGPHRPRDRRLLGGLGCCLLPCVEEHEADGPSQASPMCSPPHRPFLSHSPHPPGTQAAGPHSWRLRQLRRDQNSAHWSASRDSLSAWPPRLHLKCLVPIGSLQTGPAAQCACSSTGPPGTRLCDPHPRRPELRATHCAGKPLRPVAAPPRSQVLGTLINKH